MHTVYQWFEALLILLSSHGQTEIFSTEMNCSGYLEMANFRVGLSLLLGALFLLVQRKRGCG